MISRLFWFALGVVTGVYAAVRAYELIRASSGQATADRVVAVLEDSAAAAVAGAAGLLDARADWPSDSTVADGAASRIGDA